MAQTSKKFCAACLKEVSSDSFNCPGCGGLLTILHSRDLVGEILDGRFEVLELLGKGGMGIVYRARHRYLDRECAVKVLRADSADDPLAVARFLREAKAASGLTSPYTVRITDFGVSPDGLLYLVMELLKGESMGDMLQRVGSLHWRKAFTYAIHVCRSLQEAHARHLWHRDIKPDNIFIVREDGEEIAKVLDFGIAKWGQKEETATDAGIICGTPEYLSPEQARGAEVDGRTDVYSLGAVLYEALAGRPPFEGESSVKVLMCHIMDKPVPLQELDLPAPVPEEVAQLVMWTLKKKPRRRPTGVEDLAAAMQEALDILPDADQTEVSTPRQPKSTPTGLQFLPLVSEEDTEDEVEEVDEETTGDFMVSEDRLIADLAVMHEPPTDAMYPREEETISSTKAFETVTDGRRSPVALLGMGVLLAVAALGGWYLWQSGLTDTSVARPGAAYAIDGNPGSEAAESDTVTSPLADSRDSRLRDAGKEPGDRGREDVAPRIDQTIAHDGRNTEPIDVLPPVDRASPTRPDEADAANAADVRPLDTVAADVGVTRDAVAADRVRDTGDGTSQDAATAASVETPEEKRERQARRKRHQEARRKLEKERRAEEERRKQEEKLAKEEEARKKKEAEEQKAREQNKDEGEDDDDYTRIPGGE